MHPLTNPRGRSSERRRRSIGWMLQDARICGTMRDVYERLPGLITSRDSRLACCLARFSKINQLGCAMFQCQGTILRIMRCYGNNEETGNGLESRGRKLEAGKGKDQRKVGPAYG